MTAPVDQESIPKSRDYRHTLDRATRLMALLALAALIVGAVSAIDGNLSQLPPEIELRKCRKYARWRACNLSLASNESLMQMDNWWWVRPLQAQVPLGSSAPCWLALANSGTRQLLTTPATVARLSEMRLLPAL